MSKLILPHIILPTEFITLLKTNISVSNSPAPVFDLIRHNRALYSVLESAFKEFDDGRGVEKTMIALTWPNFRDRMASLFIYKKIYGNYASNTKMELVEDIKLLEANFSDHSVHSCSRLFLLGFYLKLANIELQNRQNSPLTDELAIPDGTAEILKMSLGRTEKIDWLLLIVLHLQNALGEKMLKNSIASGRKFNEMYNLMSVEAREQMNQNLLAYGASIKESEVFLYDKI